MFFGGFFACLFEFIAKVASSFSSLNQWEITYLKKLEGKLFLFCCPQRKTENEMKLNERENVASRKCDNKERVELSL